MPFMHSYKTDFFFQIYDVYFEYTQHYKQMAVKELKEFIFEKYYG